VVRLSTERPQKHDTFARTRERGPDFAGVAMRDEGLEPLAALCRPHLLEQEGPDTVEL
jgi:hypothetical protein